MSCRAALLHYSPGIVLGIFLLVVGAASWGAHNAAPSFRKPKPHGSRPRTSGGSRGL